MTLACSCEGPHFFTLPLKEYNGKVPYIVTDLISKLDDLKAEQIVGIFRLSAQKAVVEKICLQLDQGRIKSYDSYQDPNEIACALKRYIRELSLLDPLIGIDIEDEINDAIQNYGNSDQVFSELSNILCNKGCESRRNTLAVLAKYLNKIAKHSDVNKMDVDNLSIIFTPSFFPQSNSEASEISKTAVKLIIQDFERIFPSEKMYSPDSVYMSDDDIEIISMPKINQDYLLNEQMRRKARKDSLFPFDRIDLIKQLGISVPDRDPPPLLES